MLTSEARRGARAGILLALLLAVAAPLLAQSPPPNPTRYFNDWAGVVDAATGERIDQKLREFDGASSSQVIVAVFQKLPSASLEDFTIRTAQAWRVGRKKLDNGVVIFVFVDDRKMRMEVGYGMEGALPDITAKRILDDVAGPHFRTGNYGAGLAAATDAVMAATRGEYKASPRPAQSTGGRGQSDGGGFSFLLFIAIVMFFLWSQRRGGGRYGGGWYIGPGGFGGGGFGGGGFGGGGGGFGGGGFSGGGGSFGGGGASGSW